jgi:hypothetical protein
MHVDNPAFSVQQHTLLSPLALSLPVLAPSSTQDEAKERRRQILSSIGEDLLLASSDQPFRFPATFTFVVRSFTVLDGIGKSLDPRFDISEIAAPYARELLLEGNPVSSKLQREFKKGLDNQVRTAKPRGRSRCPWHWNAAGSLLLVPGLTSRFPTRPSGLQALQPLSLPPPCRRCTPPHCVGPQNRALKNLFVGPNKIDDLAATMQRLERGDLKLRVRALEAERALARVQVRGDGSPLHRRPGPRGPVGRSVGG